MTKVINLNVQFIWTEYVVLRVDYIKVIFCMYESMIWVLEEIKFILEVENKKNKCNMYIVYSVVV